MFPFFSVVVLHFLIAVSLKTFNKMSSYRISVDLHHYFSDERAKCYVLIRYEKGRCVNWLMEHLRHLFGKALSQPFLLLCNGHVLPAAETIDVLLADDIIVVKPLKQVNGKEKELNENTTALAADIEEMPVQTKRRKIHYNTSEQENTLTSDADITDGAGDKQLSQIKNDALALLDQYCPMDKPKRKRVRRRRQAIPSEQEDTDMSNLNQSTEQNEPIENGFQCETAEHEISQQHETSLPQPVLTMELYNHRQKYLKLFNKHYKEKDEQQNTSVQQDAQE